MSRFKLPPISPLAGSTLSVFHKVLKGNRVSPRYYFKIFVTTIFLLISSLFHWFDHLVFRRKIRTYSFKESPLFIIGFWRSGTTFLHNLLTKDPSSGYVTTYHAVFPNNLRSTWVFKTFMRIFMPNERPGDNLRITVDLPQEDEYALSNITHQSFYHSFYFPSLYSTLYDKYIRFNYLSENEEDVWKLDYRTMVIKALLSTNGRRAILKNPVNTGRMLKLQEIFPGALFIYMIRNPVIVYLSAKKFFTELFPTVNLEPFSNNEISKMILENYVRLLHDYLADIEHVHSGKIIEIRYEMLQENPMAEVEKIYRHLDINTLQEAKPAILKYLEKQKEHKVDAYTISKHELDHVLTHLDFAMKHFQYDLPPELIILDKEQQAAKEVHTII